MVETGGGETVFGIAGGNNGAPAAGDPVREGICAIASGMDEDTPVVSLRNSWRTGILSLTY